MSITELSAEEALFDPKAYSGEAKTQPKPPGPGTYSQFYGTIAHRNRKGPSSSLALPYHRCVKPSRISINIFETIPFSN